MKKMKIVQVAEDAGGGFCACRAPDGLGCKRRVYVRATECILSMRWPLALCAQHAWQLYRALGEALGETK